MAAAAVKDDLYHGETLEHLLERLEAAPDFRAESVCELANHIKTVAEAKQDFSSLAKSLYFLAEYYDEHDHYDECERLLRQAHALRDHLDLNYQIKVTNLLARAFYFLSRYEESLAYAGKALALNPNESDEKAAAMSHYHLACSYTEFGVYELALEHFHRQRELAERLGGDTLGGALFGIANIYQRMEQSEEAIQHLHHCLEYARRVGNPHLEGVNLGSLARCHLEQKHYDEALDYARQARALFEGCEDNYNLKIALGVLADIYGAKGEAETALEYYLQSLATLSTNSDADHEASLKRRLAKFYLTQHEVEKARLYLEEALLAANLTGSPDTLADVYEAMAKLHEHTGDFQRALEHYKMFHELREQTLKEAAKSRTKAMLVKFEVDRLRQEQEQQRLKTIELSSLVNTLEQLSHQDGLTGLYNRRFFDTRFKATLETARQTREPLCVVLADIDNFKRVNDTFSHAVGDEVLKIVASLFTNTLRGSDIVARYGGEEIVALFPDTTLANARTVCEKIRQKVENYGWHTVARGLQVTISMGLVSDLNAEAERLLALADANLYKAKRSGKNRVEF